MNRIALVRTVAVVVATLVALGGCVRPYRRDTRDPSLAANAPCRSSEPCAEGAAADGAGFLWTADVMESAR